MFLRNVSRAGTKDRARVRRDWILTSLSVVGVSTAVLAGEWGYLAASSTIHVPTRMVSLESTSAVPLRSLNDQVPTSNTSLESVLRDSSVSQTQANDSDSSNAGAKSARSAASLAAEPLQLITRARQAIADCQTRFQAVKDYTCTFYKRERIDGQLTQTHIMEMKARSQPHSLYFKFQQPKKGREAIFVAGRHDGKIVAHDVGFGKLFAGTLKLDPHGSMAMEENRHPVTEAGIGSLIDTVVKRWAVELTPEESIVRIHEKAKVGSRPCVLIETTHPRMHPEFLFHKVKLYIDQEHGLPIRMEAYDWPKCAGESPQLIEEYTYAELSVNVGLREIDFDAANPGYSYGRF